MAKTYEEILKEIRGLRSASMEQNNSNNVILPKIGYNIAKNNTIAADNEVRKSIANLTPITINDNPFKNRESLLTNRKDIYKNQNKTNEIISRNTAQEIGMRLMSAPRTSLAYKEKLAQQYQDSTDFRNTNNLEEKTNFQNASKNAIQTGIEESWSKYNKDLKEAQDAKYNWWDKTAGRLGLGMLKTATIKQGPQVKDENGEWYNLPTTQDVKNNAIAEQTNNGLLKFTGDVLYNAGRIATSAALNNIIPGVGSTAYFSSMYMDGYNNARQNGYDSDKSALYATISTATELLTEKLLGGTTKMVTGGKASALNQGIANGLSKIMNNKTIIKVLSHAGAEATEEFLQEYIDNVTKNIVLGENNDILSKETLENALYSAAVGAATGSLGSIGDNSLEINTKQSQNKPILPNQTTLNSLQNNNQENRYTYAPTDNQKSNSLRKSASQYFDNSQASHDFINTLDKIAQDKNYNISFDANLTSQNGNIVNAQINTNKNGEVEIKINPNSQRVGEFLIMHEVTHAIETDSMKKLVIDYASKNSEFNNALESLKQTYGTNDVSNEVLADISGQLFGNQEFINNLSMEQPSIFKRIYNAIVSMANKITGNSKESLFIKDLQNKWETAYRTQNNNLNNTEYMMIGIKGAENAIRNDSNNQFLMDNYNEANQMLKNKKDNEFIRRNTGWFQDTKGDWKFEISDHEAKIISNLEKNKTYKLGDILEHNDLYELYPELKNTKINFKDIKEKIVDGLVFETRGSHNRLTGTITINNKLINEGTESILDNLVHELQHKIQKIENFSRGSNVNKGVEQYKNNLGEIEARDTTKRRKFDEIERLNLLPVSASSNNVVNKKDKWYHFNEENSYVQENNSIFQENDRYNNIRRNQRGTDRSSRTERGKINNVQISEKNNQQSLENVSNGRKLGRNAQQQGLENSSFSFENDKWQEHLEKNYKAIGTHTNMQDIRLPKANNNQNKVNLPINKELKENNKIQDPIEISNLTKEDANTTPKLPKVNRNKISDGNSKYWNNILEKTDMLDIEQKNKILNEEEVKYYDKITNKDSLDKAFERLNKNGSVESTRWFNKDSTNADATDVAEGWILLKQYADNSDYDSMVEVAKKMRDIGSKAGQTVQAFNILERMTPEGMVKYAQSELTEAYNRMVKNKSKEWIDKHRSEFDLNPNEVQFIMDNMKEVSKMKDGYDKRVKLAEIQKLMTDKLPSQKGSKIKSWMRISMLFNPKTQVRNVVGNAIIAPVNYFGDMFSSYADKLIAKKTRTRTTGKMNVKAILKGFKDGAYQSTNDYRKGINTKDMEGNRFEIGEGKSFSEKNLIGRSLNRVEGLLNYVMDAGDRMFSQSSFENSLQNQMILNNTTEITQEMIDIARTESLQRTWNDNNNYTKFVLDVRKMLNRIGTENYGLGDILIPFAKTPANLTKAIVDYSPVGLVNTIIQGNNLRKSLNNGQYTPQMQHKFVQSLGKATAGTLLYVAGVALAQAGITSGESDDDKDMANFLKNTLGVNSFSIKIGDKSFTYDWAQPLAAPLSITANIVNSKNKENALLESIIGNLDTAGSILLEQSFLTSLNEVLNSNDGVVSGLVKQMLDLPARSIPTFSKQIADLVDGTQRTSYEYGKPLQSAVNSIKAKIPGLSKTLAPSVDSMGREIQKYGGKNSFWNVFLNPANVNTENISESAKEINRLYQEIGDKAIMPRVASYYVNKNGQKIIMTSEQKANYQKKIGNIVEKNINTLMKTTEYKNLADKEKAEVVKGIVNYSYNIAQKETLGTELSKTYEKAYEYSKIGSISDYYLFKNAIDENNKKESISNFLINSTLNNEQLAYLYGSYYSSEEKLNNLVTMNIPIKEFIKLNSQDFESDYYEKNGKAVSGSKKAKVINYVNSLKLNVAQKAILIKSQYNSYKIYDNQIVKYVNELKATASDKKVLLRSIGFDNYDKEVVQYINSQNLSKTEKEKKLKALGFTIRNGKVYAN